jgi:general stress protein 26
MPTQQEAVEKVRDMIKINRAAMLVTHDLQGGLVSRPMTTQEKEFDGDVWFFVSSDADIVREIQANSEVNVAYSRDGDYVSLSGHARLVTDIQKKKELWHEELKYWFDGKGPEAPEVMLIKVDVDTARYWDTPGDGPIGEMINMVKGMFSRNDEEPYDTGTVRY